MAETATITGAETGAEHPWPGLAPFTEDFRAYFYGRAAEIDELLRRVKRKTLTLLFGKSGLGKTSLIQAGLFPQLRREGFLPIYVRLDFALGAPGLTTQVKTEIADALTAAKSRAKKPSSSETLWEYFHRRGEAHLWDAEAGVPVLVFDQFEEIFTVGADQEGRDREMTKFLSELSDLVENRPPQSLEEALNRNPEEADQFNFAQAPYRVLVSLREDYLANLEDLSAGMPSLMENRMRLTHMDGDQALEAAVRPGRGIVQPDVGRQIVHFVAGATHEQMKRGGVEVSVDPALLCLVCRELNNERLERGQAEITADLLAGSSQEILRDFYERCITDQPAAVRAFVEEELLTESGYRENIALERAEKMLSQRGASASAIHQLVNRRLLRIEDRLGLRRVELTHDVLASTVQTSRNRRRTQEALEGERQRAEQLRTEQLAQRRKQRVTAGVACLLGLALAATIAGGYYALVQEHETYYRWFAKRMGFPVGIMPISKSEARRLPVSFILVHKGIMRDGWRLRWKPAFRVVAVNGSLKFTTDHGIGTYLWSGSEEQDIQALQALQRVESLGLHRVCQWEFVSDAEGKIAYERGLDRDGRMVWGLVYSPGGPAAASTRLARFVGPDGFSQLQRGSPAEYVQIQYDEQGWEERVMFRDARNLPAIGPDGASGRRMTHDARGLVTGLLSLDAKGSEMIDNAGNCGVLITHNQEGLPVEESSVGSDLQPMPLKRGHVIVRYQYDSFGRVHRVTYHGISGEAVIQKDGYHGEEWEYDERGNKISLTFFGIDGKPTILAGGYASWKATYDSFSRVTDERYFGPSGEPVLHKKGLHGSMTEYDQHGNPIARTFIGLEGKAIVSAHGYASWKATYDDRGKMTTASYFDPLGEPVVHKDGYHGQVAEFDQRGNEIARTFLGLDGKPVSLPDGYATWKATYDARGRITGTAYFGPSGEAVLHKNGSHGWIVEYDEDGNVTAYTFIGLDGKPVISADGYATSKPTFSERGKMTRATYFDASGEPVLHKDGNHGWISEHDERGNQIAYAYIGLDGKPIAVAGGYAAWKSVYDKRGNEIQRTFHGPSDEPALHSDGNHGWIAEYDGRGNQTAWTAIGLDGKPVALADGYATLKSTFDSRGNITQTTYFGPSGEPVLHQDGNHGWIKEYDARGNQIAYTYIGLDGRPMALAGGYAAWKSVYDERGNEIRRTFHGPSGEPVVREDGNHGWVGEYNERGNQTAHTYIGLDGKPVALSEGYASWKSTYDEYGRVTRTTYFGPSGEPALHKDGDHGWTAEYDQRGNQTAWTYIGPDGKPVASAGGYATSRSTYDARGKVIRTAYFGPSGEPVPNRDGNHGWLAEYDERGNQISWTSVGLDGKPVASADGYATSRSTYDTRGNAIRTAYFGPSGEPALNRDGNHGWIAEYDQKGNQLSKTWIDLEGKPLPAVVSISKVFAGSSAEAQGVRPDDILLRYADWTFLPEMNFDDSVAQLSSIIEAAKDERKTVLVWRDGTLLSFEFEPGLMGTEIAFPQKPKHLLEQIKSDYERYQNSAKEPARTEPVGQLGPR